jgi:hypothetical protein
MSTRTARRVELTQLSATGSSSGSLALCAAHRWTAKFCSIGDSVVWLANPGCLSEKTISVLIRLVTNRPVPSQHLQAALPHLKEGASIINTSSVTAFKGSPSLLDYSSTKGAQVRADTTPKPLEACCHAQLDSPGPPM